jgi:hypothetical protein
VFLINSLNTVRTFCWRFSIPKLSREHVLKPTFGNESFNKVSDDEGARVLNFAISKKISQSKVQHSHSITFIILLGHLLMERPIHTQIVHIIMDNR